MNADGHELPSTGNPLVDAALKRLHNDYAELKDAMIVQAHLEKQQTEMLQLHHQFLAKHEQAMSEIEDKLNALTMWRMRKEGLPEAGSGEEGQA